MKKDKIQNLMDSFEDHSYTTSEGVEFWFVRELQQTRNH